MKPPMKDEVTIKTPVLDEDGNPVIDRFGRPILEETHSKARVQYTTKTIYDQQGVAYQSTAEIDLPPNVPIEKGSEITYMDSFGKEVTENVVNVESSLNFAGNKTYFRTVYVE